MRANAKSYKIFVEEPPASEDIARLRRALLQNGFDVVKSSAEGQRRVEHERGWRCFKSNVTANFRLIPVPFHISLRIPSSFSVQAEDCLLEHARAKL